LADGRLEAFSDGVLAVAITLLVLDLRLDSTAGHASLAHQLGDHWPAFAAYLVSFFQIGVIWVNHHALLALAARVDRVLMFYNLLLLLWVTTIPFTTSTLAAFLRGGGSDARDAVLLYGLSMTGMGVAFSLILWRLVRHNLLRRPVSRAEANRALLRFGLGSLVYPASALIGLLWPPFTLIAMALLATYYMIEHTPILPAHDDGAAAVVL
jgi:uncharacterized membrane protein